MWAEDYPRFRSKIVQIGSVETDSKSTKGRNWRALLEFVVQQSSVERLPGWRRSADRTRLQPDSQLTGNFTGNFAILAPSEPSLMQDTAVLQRFLAQFPKRIIREKISKNKEFLDGIREFDLQNFKFGVARVPSLTSALHSDRAQALSTQNPG